MGTIALHKKRKKIEISNPSPSGDSYFTDPSNLAEVETRIREHKEGKSKITVILHSAEEIANFVNTVK